MSRPTIVWDDHACLPLVPNYDVAALERHRQSGVSYVSINVGMDFNPLSQVMRVIAGFRASIAAHADRFVLARSVDDVRRARIEGKLAVGFDLEGSAMLEDDVAMLGLYQDLGVRQIHLAYNRDNSIAGGCHGKDQGLTALGRQVVAEANRLGIMMDCSHSSHRTSLDVMEVSSKPVVFSHSNVGALRDHPRNLRDDQIDACARTDGVIGVSGIGIFVGDNDITTDGLIRHIDYIAQRVGVRHVGLGLDYVYEPSANDKPLGFVSKDWWPPEHYSPFDMVPPERFEEIGGKLAARGYKEADINGILGENFGRVAEAIWR